MAMVRLTLLLLNLHRVSAALRTLLRSPQWPDTFPWHPLAYPEAPHEEA